MGSNPSTPIKSVIHRSSIIDKRHNSLSNTQVTHTKIDDGKSVRLTKQSEEANKLMTVQEIVPVHNNDDDNNNNIHEDSNTINNAQQLIVKCKDECPSSGSNDRFKGENNPVVNSGVKNVSNNTVKRLFTLSDVQSMHRGNPNRILIIVENDLYDLTGFAQRHPGGSAVLRDYNGTDATTIFQSTHDDDAYVELKHWFLGHFTKNLSCDVNINNSDNQVKMIEQTSQSESNVARAILSKEKKEQTSSWMLERPYQSKMPKKITSRKNEDNNYTNQETSANINNPSANNKHDENLNNTVNISSSLLRVEDGEVTMESIEAYIHADKCNEQSKRYVIILFGDVYDVSNYAEMHPGGIRMFDKNNGKECGSIFIRIHGLRARKLVGEFYVGRLKGSRLQRPPSLPLPRKLEQQY